MSVAHAPTVGWYPGTMDQRLQPRRPLLGVALAGVGVGEGLAVEGRGALDEIEVPVRDRVEAPGVDREATHFLPPLAGAAPLPAAPSFGRLAPYFERPCLRFATPEESSVPRTMW